MSTRRITIQKQGIHKGGSVIDQGDNIYKAWSAKVQGLIFTRHETSKSNFYKARHRHILRQGTMQTRINNTDSFDRTSRWLSQSQWPSNQPQPAAFTYRHADELITSRCVVLTGNHCPLVSEFRPACLPLHQTGPHTSFFAWHSND